MKLLFILPRSHLTAWMHEPYPWISASWCDTSPWKYQKRVIHDAMTVINMFFQRRCVGIWLIDLRGLSALNNFHYDVWFHTNFSKDPIPTLKLCKHAFASSKETLHFTIGLSSSLGNLLPSPLQVFTNKTVLSFKVCSSIMTQYLISRPFTSPCVDAKLLATSSARWFRNGDLNLNVQGGREGIRMGPPPCDNISILWPPDSSFSYIDQFVLVIMHRVWGASVIAA